MFRTGAGSLLTREHGRREPAVGVRARTLRRNESFSFNWDHEPDVDDAGPHPGTHGTVWISKSSSLYFSFDGDADISINRKWLELLAASANSAGGLRLVPEPD